MSLPTPPPREAPRPLAGLRVAFAALEGYPNRKGSGVRITETVRALAARGAEVTLLTLQGDARPPPLPPGVEHRPLRILDDNYLSRALTFRAHVARALYALRPDVVHMRGPFEGRAGLEHARAARARFVFEVNGLPSVELRYHHPRAASAPELLRKLRAEEEALLRAADQVLTQSQATLRFLRLRAKAPLARGAVVPNGADPALFRPGPRPSGARLELLYAGSLAPWQGLTEVLLAMRQARRQVDLRLTAVGPARRGWTKALRAAARGYKVDDLLELADATDRERLAEQVRAADVCLAPLARDTRNRVQGCSPIKLFEYMSAGRAVLASDLPCVREIVEDGRTGRLFKASNPHRLRDALLDLARDTEGRARLGARARRFVEAEATWAHRHAAIGQVYEDLLCSTEARASA